MKNNSYEFDDEATLPNAEKMRAAATAVLDAGPWVIDPMYGHLMDKNCEPVELWDEQGVGNSNLEFIAECNPRSVIWLLDQLQQSTHSLGELTMTASINTSQLNKVIYDFIACDSRAASYQTLGQYRSALLKTLNETMADNLQISVDTALMPCELTAENGAKSALLGEFYEDIEMTCHCSDEDTDECETCNGNREYIQRVPVSWTTIKAIYAKAVDVCEAKHIK